MGGVGGACLATVAMLGVWEAGRGDLEAEDGMMDLLNNGERGCEGC